MKFKFVKEVEEPVNGGYQGIPVKTGDVVDVPDKFTNKAMKNPDYELIQGDATEIPAFTTKKKKPGRPRKYGNQG